MYPELTIGQWLQDCDPRYFGRKVMVNHLYQDYALYSNGRHTFKIRLDRIKPASYTGRKGWKMTTPPAPTD